MLGNKAVYGCGMQNDGVEPRQLDASLRFQESLNLLRFELLVFFVAVFFAVLYLSFGLWLVWNM